MRISTTSTTIITTARRHRGVTRTATYTVRCGIRTRTSRMLTIGTTTSGRARLVQASIAGMMSARRYIAAGAR